jgi:hypothetical protein
MFALVLCGIVVGRPRGGNTVYYAIIGAYSIIQTSQLSFTLWRSHRKRSASLSRACSRASACRSSRSRWAA